MRSESSPNRPPVGNGSRKKKVKGTKFRNERHDQRFRRTGTI